MDTAVFFQLKNIPVVFCLYDMRNVFDENSKKKKKNICRSTLEKYRWRLIFFFRRHLPRNSEPLGNSQMVAHSFRYTHIENYYLVLKAHRNLTYTRSDSLGCCRSWLEHRWLCERFFLFPLLLQWFSKDYWVSKLRGSGNACRECRERRTHKVALRRGVGASQLLDREIQMTWTQNHWKDKNHRNINQL